VETAATVAHTDPTVSSAVTDVQKTDDDTIASQQHNRIRLTNTLQTENDNKTHTENDITIRLNLKQICVMKKINTKRHAMKKANTNQKWSEILRYLQCFVARW